MGTYVNRYHEKDELNKSDSAKKTIMLILISMAEKIAFEFYKSCTRNGK